MNRPSFGKTAKFRKAYILAQFEATLYKVGWVSAAKDGGFHAQFYYTEPVTAVGEAVISGSYLTPVTEASLDAIPEEDRHNVHLSLHPSGLLHARSETGHDLASVNVGQWLPPKKPVRLGFLFSPRIIELSTKAAVKAQDWVFSAPNTDSGVRATITLLPRRSLSRKPNILMGWFPKYSVGVEIDFVNPATPYVFFEKAFPRT